jgi:hypothetical protein
VSRWKDIETAPKDGTHFIAYGPNDGLLFSAHFHNGKIRTEYEQWRGPITHWLPMPKPPKSVVGVGR